LIPTKVEIVEEIEAFLAESGLSQTRFGYLSAGDPSLVTKLRDGRGISIHTLDKIAKFVRYGESSVAAKNVKGAG
jgi:predicted transcriptional regulator